MSDKTFDYTRFDYHTHGAPNLFREVNKGATVNPTMPNVLEELALLLATRNPGWRLLTTGNTNILQSLYILKGDELLGHVNYVFYPRRGVDIHNKTLARTMERKNYKFTSDVTTARKLIESNFRPQPPTERASEIAAVANADWQRQVNSANNAVYETSGRLSSHFRAALVNNPEAAASLLINAGARPEIIDAFQTSHALSETYRNMSSGKIVVVVEGHYYVRNTDSNATLTVYTADEVPPKILQAVTILKLSPDTTPVEGVGAKIGTDRYLVV